MSIKHQDQKNDMPAEIAELESQFFGRPHPGRATEQLLWAYALGTLSIEEEDAAHALIAGDDHAQAALAQIHRSLEAEEGDMAEVASAAATAPAQSLACRIWGATEEALKDVWDTLSLNPEEVAAVFLHKSDGLVVRALLGAEVAIERSCLSRGLGDPEDAPQAALGSQGRKNIQLPDGTGVSVVAEPGKGFRLIVSLSDRSIQGLVKVKRLVLRKGKQAQDETGVQGRVKDGVATLKECPEGALKIIAPDGRSFIIIFGRDEPE